MTQRVMTASEVLTWIAFRKPEKWGRADLRMKFFVDDPRMKSFFDDWKVQHPSEDALAWLRLGQLLAEVDAKLLHAISENREPVYGSEEMRAAAEANQLDRDRRRKLDYAAEQLRQACAAGDVVATGRVPAEVGKTLVSSHENIPSAAFFGSDRAIKADGRLVVTGIGRSRVLWQSIEFTTSQILLLWPDKAHSSPHEVQDTQENNAKQTTRRKKPRAADVDIWYKARVSEFLSHPRHPIEKADQVAADETFGAKMISRDTIRKLREAFVVPERRPRGQVKGSPPIRRANPHRRNRRRISS